MNNHIFGIRMTSLALAVQTALAAMAVVSTSALAAEPTDEDVAVIRRPTNYVEVGGGNIGGGNSQKFGEYNGLNRSGPVFVGNFSLRGGDAYKGGDGTMRWAASGRDLGTSSRELAASIGSQGSWSLGLAYDELRHNTGSGYMTPYDGTVGGNTFTLPVTFGLPASTRTLNAVQQSALHSMEIGSTRKNTTFSMGLNLSREWDVKLEYNQLQQSGAKLMSFGSAAIGGAAGEVISILPNPTNYKTDTVNLALNWLGEKGHVNASYYGSFFKDANSQVQFQTYQGSSTLQTMSTAPSNDLHQVNLTGGYALTPVTKVVGGLSYSRNTQNDPFVYDSLMQVTAPPKSSLDGFVATSHADLKVTHQATKDLGLLASYKYDKRDNRTASNIYNFNAIDGAHPYNYPNTPLSIKKTQVELAADYRFDKYQNFRLSYGNETVSRWCGQYAVNAGYPAGTNCVVATGSREDKLSLNYRLKPSSDVVANASYSYANRAVDYDQFARVAMVSVNGGGIAGLNGGDFVGFHPYIDENRRQQIFKGTVNWQAREQLALTFTGKFVDNVYDTQFGWKKGSEFSLGVDATYSLSETGSISAYVMQQRRVRDRTDEQTGATATAANATRIGVPAYATYNGTLRDEDFTVGLGVKESGLFHGKLALAGDVTYSVGRTTYGTWLNYFGTTTGGLTCGASIIMSCGELPDINNSMIQIKLSGSYNVDKSSKVAVGYLYRHLASNDYYYNGLQNGYTPTSLMPTNGNSGSFAENVVAVSYSYSFK